ncbi:uncharacterized protein LOC120104580 [Phoenix dactylifera]|uniref:Uncharacterized protein LOC120104580 n=1 Tax=Phoenix dactylifera TaxID=42345 RepID=A0A8B8ZEY7_PHODC|nr:uncharacterized protein LOC120104580 [Phoenix dactylifera]
MTSFAGGGFLPARNRAMLSPKTLASPPDSELHPTRKPRPCRRVSNAAFPSAAGSRPRKGGAGLGGRRSGPSTPLLRWKFDDADHSTKPLQESSGKPRRRAKTAAGAAPPVSVRKIAAGIWHLWPPQVSGGGGGGETRRARVALEPVPGHLQVSSLCKPDSTNLHTTAKNELMSPISVLDLKNGDTNKLKPSAALPSSAMERATKWDPGSSKASDELYRFCGHLNLLEGNQVTAVSVVSTLRAELKQAYDRISELETERQSAKKKLDHFLSKLAEEKALWRSREHEKARAIIDGMKDDFNREKKNRQRMEIVNSRLVDELAEAKLSVKRLLQDYEKERKARELIEEICNELAKEIEEGRAEVEAMKRESMRIREEVEEERRMLQMAEVWREERVQMKLIDAKITLEDKYSQLSKLQKDIEAFLKAQNAANSDNAAIEAAASLQIKANSVMLQEIKGFTFHPPLASEDIRSVFEEHHPREEINEREIVPCSGYGPSSHASKIHMANAETDVFLEKATMQCANGAIDTNGGKEDDSGWETLSHDEEQSLRNSPEGSVPSVKGIYEESNASSSGTEWEENGVDGELNNEIGDVQNRRHPRKNVSSISRLWRSSCPNNGENCKMIPVELTNGRLSNGKNSNGTFSPNRGSGEVGLSPPSMGHWSSPDSPNPHLSRRMKGCIEWPRGAHKHSLKVKLLEARMESQKIQLRHVLQQKI